MVKKRFDGWLIVSVLLLVLFIAVLIYPMFGVIKQAVIMPDGSETTPARYFGTEDISDVFIPWYDVKGELWPGETA